MKKLLSFLITFLSIKTIVLPAHAQAQGGTKVNLCDGKGLGQTLCNLQTADIGYVIGTIINVAFIIAILAALAYLVIGGIKWIMSGGDKSAVEAARENIIAAIIGLIVVLMSYFIINLLMQIFFGTGISGLELPTLRK